jgi:acyl-CoA hydrolase
MKKIIDSYTEQVHIVNSSNINGYGRLFGGQLMQWIDETAAVVARRHSQKNVTTAAVDRLQFRKEARANDTVVLRGYLTYVGNTSMEVKVKSYVEKLNGERVLINEAYVVMIAIDENEKPTSVPGLILTTDKEKEEWEQGKIRREERKRY